MNDRRDEQEFDSVTIRLASPETVRSWSRGEVTKPETINYRTQKPERDGLFCERIFGPVKDYECNCGKYKGIKFKGSVCERCKVEVTLSKVRRERMGHIELAAPVAHIWFYKVPPSRIGALLDLPANKVESILYYESYVVIEPAETSKEKGELLSDREYEELMAKNPKGFVAKMGAGAIYDLLKQIDLDELSQNLRMLMKVETAPDRRKKILKRLQIVEGFRNSGVRPEWMMLEVLPVIPPELRPLVPLEGGRFATSDLNDLYRRVITRNSRLKHLIVIKAPEIILRNEKRMLQEAVDAVLDNSRRARPVKGRGDRPLKSLSDALKGKQGRFRRNLLGKRVDYSGRSVIVVGPELNLHQCGLPKTMAVELFKPFIIRELEKRGYAQSIKGARKLLETGAKEVWEILEEVVKDHPVLLNRAPTLHRVSIQAFMPVLSEGKAIRIHPLVCKPYNADFDGDAMSVHVPLSLESQIESLVLMLSTNNILSPANGKPLSVPTQDIILGIYWLTKEKAKEKGEGKIFDSIEEIERALETKSVTLHTKIRYRLGGKVINTTVGRVIFNSILPSQIGFINQTLERKDVIELIGIIYNKVGGYEAVRVLDKMKKIGFEYATLSGTTISVDDMKVPDAKNDIIRNAFKEIASIQEDYENGIITEGERYNRVIDSWTHATNRIEKETLNTLRNHKDGFNPLYMMATSGARGNMDQVRQITGVRGLMTKPQKKGGRHEGEIVETPINSNFKEGLTVLEYFISTHGARKGLTDTALKTAQSGYLTRKLVDVAQDVTITEADCGTIMGIEVGAIKEGEEIIEPLSERIKGRSALDDIVDPITLEKIVSAGEEIGDEEAEIIEECGIEKMRIRSVITCEAKMGLCQKCYGRNLATGRLVEIGEAVGVMAAQSIGEPGTQLTLRTFHIGGTATRIARESQMKAPTNGKVRFSDVTFGVRKDGRKIVLSREGKIIFGHERGEVKYKVPYGASLHVKDGQEISRGDVMFEWDPYSFAILAEEEGKVKFSGLIENITYRLEYDERIGRKQPVVVEHKKIHPEINIYNNGRRVSKYHIPTRAYIFVKEGEAVSPGDLLAKVPREIAKTRDITGGLPKVIELFEARTPKNAAIVTEIDGEVSSIKLEKNTRTVVVKGEHEEREYKVPYGRYLTIYEGQSIKAGDKLCEGVIDPHDILRIKGVQAVQEYLVNQIQEVYRLQGVKINDKHIGIIVRQMLSKVKVKDAGDTGFIEGEIVDKVKANEENKKVVELGGKPAVFHPVLLGVTKAILSTDSFISAASFQETTRVLTDAAIRGKRDDLSGIKENVVMGNLIPAGTGLRKYQDIELKGGNGADDKSVSEEREKEEES